MKRHRTALLFATVLTALPVGAQTPAEQARAAFEKFVAAQNAHDLKAVERLLSDSSGFLWITRGTAIWSRPEALKRFEALYQGTWHLEPDYKDFRVVVEQPNLVQIFVPIVFSIGPAGQAAQDTRFLMNQTLCREPSGWRIASILPIPVPPPAPPKP